jgi:regulator of sigma E protease
MMITILLGLAGLGLVVLFHEIGHYLAARAVGIEVETFAIGWGPKLAGFKKAGTEWQISVFPVGGFCKMKGEDAFRRAISEHLEELPREKGSFYGATALRRIVVALAGPIANIVFAVIVFSLVAAIGYTIRTTPAKIILASQYSFDTTPAASAPSTPNPADEAGLKTGDLILSIAGKPVLDYSDIQNVISTSPGKSLPILVEREGRRIETAVVPRLDKSSGAGRIGIYSWIEPIVSSVEAGSAAALAGLAPGDILTSLNARAIGNSLDIVAAIKEKPEKVTVSYTREGTVRETRMILSWAASGESNFGVGFRTDERTIRSANPASAIVDGAKETWNTCVLTLKSIGMLFSGVDVLKAISGPARITWMVGKATQDSVNQSGVAGLVQAFNFLAFLSVGLFIMNLLPIPALDGGLILMFIAEIARKRPLKAKTIIRFQYAGSAMILVLFLVATLSDILFFAKL